MANLSFLPDQPGNQEYQRKYVGRMSSVCRVNNLFIKSLLDLEIPNTIVLAEIIDQLSSQMTAKYATSAIPQSVTQIQSNFSAMLPPSRYLMSRKLLCWWPHLQTNVID